MAVVNKVHAHTIILWIPLQLYIAASLTCWDIYCSYLCTRDGQCRVLAVMVSILVCVLCLLLPFLHSFDFHYYLWLIPWDSYRWSQPLIQQFPCLLAKIPRSFVCCLVVSCPWCTVLLLFFHPCLGCPSCCPSILETSISTVIFCFHVLVYTLMP